MHLTIDGRRVGPGEPSYIVAELSGNHNGDLQRAIETIHAAADAGVDAVKLQTYTADTLTIDHPGQEFVVPGTGPWGGRTLYDLYNEAHTPWSWHETLFSEARGRGLQIFSSPFDRSAVEFLKELRAPAYKIASFELIDDDLLEAVAGTGKPVVLSTGMASLENIGHALRVLRDAGATQVLLLRCTSSYPAPDASMNLTTIPALAKTTGCPVGLSDHSHGVTAAIVAVTLGACFIEKHITLNRADGGVDSHFSLEPDEFAQLVREVRRAEEMMGSVTFGPGVAEEGSIVFRRSLYAVQDIGKGEEFTEANVRSIRPGFGLEPQYLDVVLRMRASSEIPRGTALTWQHLSGV